MKSKCEKAYLKGVNLSGVGRDWDEIWENFKGLNWFGRRLKKEQGRVLKKILSEIKLARSAKIVDVGCGPGFTLSLFRGLGYDNSIGIDLSNNSLTLCNKLFGFKRGKDVFLMDAKNIKFPDNSFDLVFSDGLLEHFELKDLTAVAEEMCRISESWILLFQPDHQSLLGRLRKIAEKFLKVSWEGEISYRKSDYVRVFSLWDQSGWLRRVEF